MEDRTGRPPPGAKRLVHRPRGPRRQEKEMSRGGCKVQLTETCELGEGSAPNLLAYVETAPAPAWDVA